MRISSYRVASTLPFLATAYILGVEQDRSREDSEGLNNKGSILAEPGGSGNAGVLLLDIPKIQVIYFW